MKSKSSPSAPLNLCPPVGVTGTTLPASPVKDTPDFSGLAPIFDKAELASMKAAASPVESVGVAAPDSAPLMDGRENLHGVTFVSKNHVGKTPWTVEHYHRNGEWVCRESQYGTTMNFHEREIKAWRKAPPVDGFKLQPMRLREERSRIIVMEDGSMLVANTEDEAEAIVAACSSHAAKDAKIRALEGAARDALQMIQNLRADCENGKFLDRERISGGLFHHVSTLDAALALPCAPQGS